MSVETRLRTLEKQMQSARRQLQAHDEYIDTVSSALWKRVLWWLQGYYFRKVGRWR